MPPGAPGDKVIKVRCIVIKKELKKPGNQIAGTAAQSPINMGKTAAEIGIDILEGKDYDTETFEEVFMIDADNVDMYGVDGWQ